MTGETYILENIRVSERAKALLALEKAKALEAKREERVRKGTLKKQVSYNPNLRLTTIHYYV